MRGSAGGRRLEATAYHEAGHAVAHYAFHQRFKTVSIVPDFQAGTAGCVEPYKYPRWLSDDVESELSPRARAMLEAEAIQLLSGSVAERRYRGRWNHEGAASDRHHAVRLASYVQSTLDQKGFRLYFRWLWHRAECIFENPGYWAAVQALAAQLLEQPTMRGSDAWALIRRVAYPELAPTFDTDRQKPL